MKVDLSRIETIDSLIRRKFTGNPNELATKLNISLRTLHDTLNFMKNELNAPIVYNSTRRSYCYKEDGLICFKYQKKN